jgi:putative oxidoreductase
VTTPHFFVPSLAPVYRGLEPLTLPLLRVVTGLWLVPHGWSKLSGGIEGTAGWLASEGFPAPVLMAWLVALTETVGGLLLAAGFLTRLVAVPVIIFLITATFYHAKNGFFWPDGGFEYPLFWAVAAFVFLVRGGGALSVDRAIGKEF